MRGMRQMFALLLAALLACAGLPAALTEGAGDEETPQWVEFEEQAACPDLGFDSDAAAAGFINRAMAVNQQGRVMFRAAYGSVAGRRLTGIDYNIYLAVKPMIAEVARGERSSTELEIPLTAIYDKASYTPADFELESFYDEDGAVTAEAQAAVDEKLELNEDRINRVLTALLVDCPYDLYWYDKTLRFKWTRYNNAFNGESYTINYRSKGVSKFKFWVSRDYSTSGNTGTLEMDTSKAAAVQSAVQNAGQILESSAGLSDMDKLTSYKEAICDLASYNNAASGPGDYPYGDPWQLVWVFDGDPDTEVVCEGYSKAFQYLCDMSQFDEDISVISVQGNMYSTGGNSGLHMWNLVNMGGVNYLVDLTNCDSGYSGYPDKLFMKGYSYMDDAGNYCFETGKATITYSFDIKITNLFKAEDLTYTDDPSIHAWSGWTYIEEPTCVDAGSRKRTCDTCGKTETEEVPATGVHTWGEWETTQEPTCVDTGTREHVCSVCAEIETEEIPATDLHSWGDWEIVDEPGCTEPGAREHVCGVCDESETEEIPATGHSWGDWEIVEEPGCTEPGARKHVCGVCDESETEEILATGHDWETLKGVAATCTADGMTDKIYCAVCGEVSQEPEPLPMLGHHYAVNGVPRSDCYPGIACERCGEVLLPAADIGAGDVFTLPRALTVIEPEAFAGDAGIRAVVAPEGLTAIGARAFENCAELRLVFIGKDVRQIGSDAFKGCDQLILVIQGENPYALKYAEDNGIYVYVDGN